jgi:ribosomal protein S18 acetylase RimI-like enzyme
MEVETMSPRSKEVAYRIEAAAESDWPWIVQGQIETIWIRLDPERQRRISRQAIEESVEHQVARLRKDEGFPNQAFIARAEDGTSAGFVWVARDHNDSTGELEATLLNQYVAESFRGQGLGRRLLKTAEEWARDQGLPRISLSVGVHNTIGQRLYESFGYQAVTLRMTKRLGPGEPDEFFLDND